MASKADTLTAPAPAGVQEREAIFDIFRRWGYLQATLDPLGQYLPPEPFPVTTFPKATSPPKPAATTAAPSPSSSCTSPASSSASGSRSESSRHHHQAADQAHVLTQLIRADLFEQVIQQRYLGTKRFSLEGLTVLIPFLDQVFATAAAAGVTRAILAMSHRGRLNVMTNTIGRSPSEIFAKFEDVDPRSRPRRRRRQVPHGRHRRVHLAQRQDRRASPRLQPQPPRSRRPRRHGPRPRPADRASAKTGKQQILPIIIHGDAAFAGQGIPPRRSTSPRSHGYNVGGTMHIIVNNLLGFTANPEESNSSRFATDLAKRLPIPIFHVNAEDPDAVVRIAAIAAEYRQRFHSDVVVDLIGYRRHGHSEVDDPTVTQPRRYALIKDHPPLYQLYARSHRRRPRRRSAQTIQEEFLDDQKRRHQSQQTPPSSRSFPTTGSPTTAAELDPRRRHAHHRHPAPSRVLELSRLTTNYPAGFHIHPKVQKLYEQRVEMGDRQAPLRLRLPPNSSPTPRSSPKARPSASAGRTRSAAPSTSATPSSSTSRPKSATPRSLTSSPTQARFEVYNSLLSEAAVLGFEYGYSRDYPEALVLWEAQFGDFANGAQIIIDQFIAAGEAKWGLLSGVVMLLPHGYEGQGPEHSSARIERFLQLAASDNMSDLPALHRRAVLPSPAPPGAALVAQAARRLHAEEHAAPSRRLIDRRGLRLASFPERPPRQRRERPASPPRLHRQDRPQPPRRARQAQGLRRVGIIFLEQLYPWPEEELQAALDQHPGRRRDRLGAGRAGQHGRVLLRHAAAAPSRRRSRRAQREAHASASPATGSAKAHEIEEKTLIDLAFGSAD